MDISSIIKARRASMEEYLKSKGEVLSKEGRQYRVKGRPGLVVSGNKWYNHTLSVGGNTLDYLVKMEGIDFKKSVETLTESIITVKSAKPVNINNVTIPERNANDKRAMAYLIKKRGIKAELIIPLLRQGRIYESAGVHNCVFTGVDENCRIRYVMQRSTLSGSCLKFESEGSDKRYSFSLAGKNSIVCIFESPIDLLSYLSIHKKVVELEPHMLSLGGVSDITIDSYLERIPGIRQLVFCLDNDKAGNEAYELLHKKYMMMGLKICRHSPKLKDWNEQLLSNMGI